MSLEPNFRNRIRALRAIGRLTADELNRVGLMEQRHFTSITHLLYLAYWWVTAVVVALLPTWSGESVIYFGVVVALAGAWLVATPQLGATLLTTDFGGLRPGKAAWERIRAAFRKERLELPEASADEEQELIDSLERWVPGIAPVSLLQLVLKFAWMALKLGVVGLIGILIGPLLSTVHWWHSWSPVSALYGVAAPWALALLVSLVVPVIVQLYIAALRVDQASGPPPDEGPTAPTKPR